MPLFGYFVDTNLLVLYVVGQVDPNIISKHRRLEDYSVEDYYLLIYLIDQVDRLYVTPNTLTETSNLLRQHQDPERALLVQGLSYIIQMSNEITIASATVANGKPFLDLGLTDAVLCEVVSEETPLLTVDLNLYLEMLVRGGEKLVINFTNLRNF